MGSLSGHQQMRELCRPNKRCARVATGSGPAGCDDAYRTGGWVAKTVNRQICKCNDGRVVSTDPKEQKSLPAFSATAAENSASALQARAFRTRAAARRRVDISRS